MVLAFIHPVESLSVQTFLCRVFFPNQSLKFMSFKPSRHKFELNVMLYFSVLFLPEDVQLIFFFHYCCLKLFFCCFVWIYHKSILQFDFDFYIEVKRRFILQRDVPVHAWNGILSHISERCLGVVIRLRPVNFMKWFISVLFLSDLTINFRQCIVAQGLYSHLHDA